MNLKQITGLGCHGAAAVARNGWWLVQWVLAGLAAAPEKRVATRHLAVPAAEQLGAGFNPDAGPSELGEDDAEVHLDFRSRWY